MKRGGEKEGLYIAIEDEAGIEGFPMEAIVPLVFTKKGKRIEAECYFGVYGEARAFLLKNSGNPFSKKALFELNEALAPYLRANGYARAGGLYRFYRSFVIWEKDKLNAAAIRSDSVMLDEKTVKSVQKNFTGFDLKELLEYGLPAAMTVLDNEVVSIATVNMHGKKQRLLEAAVYTRKERRGRGYGASNVALLSKTLLEDKKGVVYVCSCHNAPSIRLARSLGFENESKFYAVDAYKCD